MKRPRKTTDGYWITVRVPPDLFEAAQAKAEKEKRSISNLTREALQRYVEE